MKIIDQGLVYSGKNHTDRQSCAFGQICVLPGGKWLCGFRTAPAKKSVPDQKAVLMTSSDRGKTWQGPVEPFTPPPIDGRPGAFRALALTALGGPRVMATLYWVDISNPELPFFNETTWGLLDSRIFHAFSEDEGQTWTAPKEMDTTVFSVPVALTGPTLKLANGELACQFELNKHYYDETPWRHSSVIMFSADGGHTWPRHQIVTSHPTMFYWDQRPAVLQDCTLLDLFWTYDNQAGAYKNIHACRSVDHGRTWSDLWDTGVPGQPAPPRQFPDKTLAMVYVDRTGSPEIKIRLSRDSGETWPAETEMTLYSSGTKNQTWNKHSMEDAWAEMGEYSIGLPATDLTSDHHLLTIFYAGPATDQTDIHWMLLEH